MCTGLSTLAEVQIQDSRVWRRAHLISGGQQVWSLQTSYEQVTDRFNGNGKIEPLGRTYARAITWGELVGAETTEAGKADLRSYMGQRGVNEKDVAATSSYDLERENLGLSLDWAYGLTRRWQIGFQIPLTMRRTKVHSNVELTPTLAGGAGMVGQKSLLALSDGMMREKVRALANERLTNSGYDDVPDENESWDWGDISLLSQFYLYEGIDFNWALQELVRFPSSRNPSVSDYFEQAGDDGQTDLGLSSLMDYQLRSWTLGLRVGYVYQLPDSAKMRVSDEEDRDGVDPKVNRDLGDWVWGSVDADYRLNRAFGLEAEYAFLSKSRDRYKSEARDLTFLERETDQDVHQARLGAVYNFDGRSARRGVENKWVASLGYTYPFVGRNSADASRTTLEIITYF
jgi:hypothetical protein